MSGAEWREGGEESFGGAGSATVTCGGTWFNDDAKLASS